MTALLALLAAATATATAAPPPAQPIRVPAVPASALPPFDPNGLPYRAEGIRPHWALDVQGGTVTFRLTGRTLTLPTPPARLSYDGFHWAAEGAFGGIRIDVRHIRCSGFKHSAFPDTVTIKLNRQTVHGCGGNSLPTGHADALEGTYWRLHLLDRQKVGQEVDASLRFSQGRVVGRDGCNAFGAIYTLTPGRLHFGDAISTEVSCRPGEHAVERALYTLLGQDMGITRTRDKLILVSADGHAAWFRRIPPYTFQRTKRWKIRADKR